MDRSEFFRGGDIHAAHIKKFHRSQCFTLFDIDNVVSNTFGQTCSLINVFVLGKVRIHLAI